MPAVPGKMEKPSPWPPRLSPTFANAGDAALFAWTKKLDHFDPARVGVWISRKEIRSAERHVSPTFLNAIRRAARNVRGVSEKQLPRPWSFESEPGVRISQRVSPIESIGCYIPGGHFFAGLNFNHDRRSRPSRRRFAHRCRLSRTESRIACSRRVARH